MPVRPDSKRVLPLRISKKTEILNQCISERLISALYSNSELETRLEENTSRSFDKKCKRRCSPWNKSQSITIAMSCLS